MEEDHKNANIMVTPIPSTHRLDRYGFILSESEPTSPVSKKPKKDEIWLENSRTKKWVKMVGKQNEDWDICKLKRPKKLKSRIRKGIPEALRGHIWRELSFSRTMMQKNPNVYREFLAVEQWPFEDTILRDIGRTFPKHSLFLGDKSIGQDSLTNVLKAYSLYDPELGYCQGMGFIAAMFLSYMPEEKAFWQIVACLTSRKYNLADLYRPGMPKVPESIFILEQLMKIYLNNLFVHMNAEGVHPTMYATQWFITIFSYSYPFQFVTRIWDIFLNEGWKFIYRTSIGLLKVSQKELLKLKFEGILGYLRELPQKVNTDEVIEVSLNIPLKTAQLENLQDSYKNTLCSKN